MFNSTILDVAVGMIFVFLAVSLAASAVVEAIAGVLKWRSATLLQGVKDLLNDDKFTGLAVQLYRHALINPRNSGSSRTADEFAKNPVTRALGATFGSTADDLSRNAPAYIDPKQFANALIDILNTGHPPPAPPQPGAAAAQPDAPAAGHPGKMADGNPGSIARAIDYVVPHDTDRQINELLQGIARRADGDLDKMRQEISDWFDNAMDRVSGSYKRKTQLWNFVIALAMVALLNISALHAAKTFWLHPETTKIIDSAITPAPPGTGNQPPSIEAGFATLDKLRLPIGWDHAFDDWKKMGDGERALFSLELALGWLITAAATLFGAPFWFDLLQRVVRLKAAGPSPQEKQTGTAAAL